MKKTPRKSAAYPMYRDHAGNPVGMRTIRDMERQTRKLVDLLVTDGEPLNLPMYWQLWYWWGVHSFYLAQRNGDPA